MSAKEPQLYVLVLVLMMGVVVVAWGGGLFGQTEPWFLQWQHQAFAGLCHQLPERSFWIGGQPMAVCSRCFGIYTGFLLGWFLLPSMALIKQEAYLPSKKILLAAVILNFADVFGNLLGFWQNTLVSRLILGWFVGISAALLFSGAFFIIKNKQTEGYYGRNRSTGARG